MFFSEPHLWTERILPCGAAVGETGTYTVLHVQHRAVIVAEGSMSPQFTNAMICKNAQVRQNLWAEKNRCGVLLSWKFFRISLSRKNLHHPRHQKTNELTALANAIEIYLSAGLPAWHAPRPIKFLVSANCGRAIAVSKQRLRPSSRN